MVSQNRTRRGLRLQAPSVHLQTGAALIALASSPGAATAAASGFNFCAPPLRPTCIEAPDAAPLCEGEVQGFVKAVFKYRECLEKETERAVREANETLDAWKCRSSALRCRR